MGEKPRINQPVSEDFQNKSRFEFQRGNGTPSKLKMPPKLLELLHEIYLPLIPDPIAEERQKVLRQLEQLARERRHNQNGSH